MECAGCHEMMTSKDLDYNQCPGCDLFFCYVCEKNFTIIRDEEVEDSCDDEAYIRYCQECSSS